MRIKSMFTLATLFLLKISVAEGLPLNHFETFIDETSGITTFSFTNQSTSTSDNEFVYTVSSVDNAINVLQRGPDNRLTLLGSIVADEDLDTGARSPINVVISPDDRHLYVAAVTPQRVTPTIYVYDIDQNSGLLQQIQMYQDRGLQSSTELLFSEDGQSLYVTSVNSRSVTVLSRSANGLLTESQFLPQAELSRNFTGLSSNPVGMTISPDQEHFYVGFDRFNTNEGIISHFLRDIDTGSLTYVDQVDYTQDNLESLARSESIVISPDGSFLYAVTDDLIFEFTIDSNGSLVFNRITLIEEDDPLIGTARSYVNMVLSNNGQLAYLTDAVLDAVFVFLRDELTGELNFVGAEVDRRDGVQELRQADRIVLSNDNLYAYVGSAFAFTVFNIATDIEVESILDVSSVPDEPIQLIITVINNGPTTAHSIFYSGEIDIDSTIMSVDAFSNATDCEIQSQTVTCFLDSMIPEEAEEIIITLARDQDGPVEISHNVNIAEVDTEIQNNNYLASFQFSAPGSEEGPAEEPDPEANTPPEDGVPDDESGNGEDNSGSGSTGPLIFIAMVLLLFARKRLKVRF